MSFPSKMQVAPNQGYSYAESLRKAAEQTDPNQAVKATLKVVKDHFNPDKSKEAGK